MRKFIYLIALLLLVTCNQNDKLSLNCDQIAILRGHVGTAISPHEFQQWVSTTYQQPLNNITIMPAAVEVVRQGMVTEVAWQNAGLQYGAQFGEKELLRVWVWKTNTPGDQLLACLGQPTHYFATSALEESGPARSIYLFFPTRGIMVYGWQIFRATIDTKSIPVVDGQFPFQSLMIVKPQSVEQTIEIGWGDFGSDILRQLKPWPGDWAKIEFPPYPE